MSVQESKHFLRAPESAHTDDMSTRSLRKEQLQALEPQGQHALDDHAVPASGVKLSHKSHKHLSGQIRDTPVPQSTFLHSLALV